MHRTVYRMNITRAEFERLLLGALGGSDFAVDGDTFSGGDDLRNWRIRVGPEEVNRIGMVRLALREVAIELAGYDDAGAKAFMARFDLYFRKGGG